MHQALIFADGVENITVEGGGTIDGNGDVWWACFKSGSPPLSDPPCSGYSRPHLVMIKSATNVIFKNVKVQRSPNWTLHFAWVTNLIVSGLYVYNPSGAPNADGIDLDCVQNAVVESNYFDVGDDALCVKSGVDYNGRKFGRPSRDIVFRDNVIGHGHGITIGSEMSGGIFNVTFDNITMNNTGCGPRIKTQRGRGGVVDGITYRNIVAENVGEMIQMTMEYSGHLPATNATATPVLRNFLFENVSFRGGDNAGRYDGLAESPIVNVTLRNVSFNGGHASFGTCQNVIGGRCEGPTAPCPPCFAGSPLYAV